MHERRTNLSEMSGRSGGDEQTFDAMVRAHYGRLCDFVYRYVRSRATAEDIVQDIFVRILRSERFDYDDPLPYLYRAARNGAASHVRQQRTRERLRAQAGSAAGSRRAEAEAEYHELAEAVDHAIDSLPARAREIFTMSRVQGLTYAEIARTLGLSIKTVDNQMGRALKLLRVRLAPYLPVGAALLAASHVVDRLLQ